MVHVVSIPSQGQGCEDVLKLNLDHTSSYPTELKKGVTTVLSKPPRKVTIDVHRYERLLLYDLNMLDHEVKGSRDVQSFKSFGFSGF